MKTQRLIALVAVVAFGIAAAIVMALQPGQGETHSMNGTDLATLQKLVSLDPAPERVHWETVETGAGTDWALVAHLVYGPDTLEQVLAAAPREDGMNGAVAFPALGWMERLDLGGGVFREGDTFVPSSGVRSAAAFEKSPLTDGFLVELDNGPGFILYLTTR